MNDLLYVALVALATGIISLIIGIIARAGRVMLGCAATLAAIGGGVALAVFLWK